jgi:serine/threonine protein kinase
MYEVIDDPDVDKIYIIIEYLHKGSIMDKMKIKGKLTEEETWIYFRDMIRGIDYCKAFTLNYLGHEVANIIHWDIKPENLLIDKTNRIKVADFGVSLMMENNSDNVSSTAGSMYFFAPEVCMGNNFKGKKSDVWACGVTLYNMSFNDYPF